MRVASERGLASDSLSGYGEVMTTTVVRPSGGHPSRLVAAEVRAELGRQQLSQRRFALKLGAPYSWVNRRIASCEVEITFEDLERMAEALNVPVQRLISAWLPRMDSNHQPAGYPTRVAHSTAVAA